MIRIRIDLEERADRRWTVSYHEAYDGDDTPHRLGQVAPPQRQNGVHLEEVHDSKTLAFQRAETWLFNRNTHGRASLQRGEVKGVPDAPLSRA